MGLIIETELRLGKGSEIGADGRRGVVAAGSLGEMKKTSKVTASLRRMLQWPP